MDSSGRGVSVCVRAAMLSCLARGCRTCGSSACASPPRLGKWWTYDDLSDQANQPAAEDFLQPPARMFTCVHSPPSRVAPSKAFMVRYGRPMFALPVRCCCTAIGHPTGTHALCATRCAARPAGACPRKPLTGSHFQTGIGPTRATRLLRAFVGEARLHFARRRKASAAVADEMRRVHHIPHTHCQREQDRWSSMKAAICIRGVHSVVYWVQGQLVYS